MEGFRIRGLTGWIGVRSGKGSEPFPEGFRIGRCVQGGAGGQVLLGGQQRRVEAGPDLGVLGAVDVDARQLVEQHGGQLRRLDLCCGAGRVDEDVGLAPDLVVEHERAHQELLGGRVDENLSAVLEQRQRGPHVGLGRRGDHGGPAPDGDPAQPGVVAFGVLIEGEPQQFREVSVPAAEFVIL